MRKEIFTENAPAAIGPYSQAIQVGDFVFASGQIGVDPKTGEAVEGIEAQTHQVMKNIQAVLTEVGADFSDVVKFTIFLDSMDDFATVNELYGSYLEKPYPARSTVEVSRLPKDLLVEMEVIIYKK
ncbi:MAG TPA: RidA family protein [Bacillota bacterium]|nr:RidA family protein [Bacillota bacterium]